MKREELRIEWQLVLMGSVEIMEEESEKFIELFEQKFYWSEVIFQLVTHRTLNMFYVHDGIFDVFNKKIRKRNRTFNGKPMGSLWAKKFILL